MSDATHGGDEFAQFRKTFFEECRELLSDLDERLARLQDEIADPEELNAIFRAVHSIKAGAGAFNFTQLVAFSHKYEALLDWLRDGRIQQDEKVADVLIRAGDILAALVEAAQTGEQLGNGYGAQVAEELAALLREGGPETPEGEAEPATGETGGVATQTGPVRYRIGFTPHAELFRHANEPLLLIRELKRLGEVAVRCDSSRLPALSALETDDACLAWEFDIVTDKGEADLAEVFEFVDEDCALTIERVEAGETVATTPDAPAEDGVSHEPTNAAVTDAVPGSQALAAPASPAATNPAAQPQAPGKAGGARAPAVSSIRVDLDRIDRLVNVVGELVITQSMLAQQYADQTGGNAHQSAQGQEELATLTRELQECVMAIRMQPVKSVFARMPRLVREVSTRLDKKVRLLMSGEQTEVDKTVIEELADPLTHMIRNAIDHGIEDPAARRAAGKKEEGVIKLSAKHAGGSIVIQVLDDGAGINRERLLRKAVEKGIVAEDAKLSEDEIDDLIFAPGFSTAEAVTDVSGRGVGMDVVRRNIVNLGGRINVQSIFGRGTRFTLTIPLTLAVLDGMLIAVGREKYILPLTSIVESFRPEPAQLRKLAGGGQVVSIRGEFIRLVYLHRVFDVHGAVSDPSKGLVVVVETGNGTKIGVVVDELIGQQQVVIKSLQENFDPVQGVSGATILGNGKVALILDIEQLKTMPEHTLLQRHGQRPNALLQAHRHSREPSEHDNTPPPSADAAPPAAAADNPMAAGSR